MIQIGSFIIYMTLGDATQIGRSWISIVAKKANSFV